MIRLTFMGYPSFLDRSISGGFQCFLVFTDVCSHCSVGPTLVQTETRLQKEICSCVFNDNRVTEYIYHLNVQIPR